MLHGLACSGESGFRIVATMDSRVCPLYGSSFQHVPATGEKIGEGTLLKARGKLKRREIGVCW
jgi:hypothetical protein